MFSVTIERNRNRYSFLLAFNISSRSTPPLAETSRRLPACLPTFTHVATTIDWLPKEQQALLLSFCLFLLFLRISTDKRRGGEQERKEKTTICWLCGELFFTKIEKIREYGHTIVEVRGAAHIKCNLICKQKA